MFSCSGRFPLGSLVFSHCSKTYLQVDWLCVVAPRSEWVCKCFYGIVQQTGVLFTVYSFLSCTFSRIGSGSTATLAGLKQLLKIKKLIILNCFCKEKTLFNQPGHQVIQYNCVLSLFMALSEKQQTIQAYALLYNSKIDLEKLSFV